MTPPFPLPVLFTAWTWRDGAGIAGEVIRRAKLGGFKTVAVELSEDTGGDPGSSLDAQDVRYLKDAGLTVVGWGPVDTRIDIELGLVLDGWLPQVEGPGQRDALLSALAAGVGGLIPRALVTTYGGLDTAADVAALVKAWGGMPFTFVECYKADGPPHDDVSRMLAQGTVYGFKADALRALVGTYRGERPADYSGLTSANFGGIYLEENTDDGQLGAFAALQAIPPPPTPEPTPVTNDASARNAQVASITQTWLDNFGPAPLSRMACEHDIAASDDATWSDRRLDVRNALNGDTAKARDAMEAQLEAVTAERDSLKSQLASAQSALDAASQKIAAAKAALG